jgi:hypothetical protein
MPVVLEVLEQLLVCGVPRGIAVGGRAAAESEQQQRASRESVSVCTLVLVTRVHSRAAHEASQLLVELQQLLVELQQRSVKSVQQLQQASDLLQTLYQQLLYYSWVAL